MNLKKLLSVATLFVAGALGFNANAQYTADDLKNSGWTEVSELTNIADNYYVLVSKTKDFSVDANSNDNLIHYRTLTNPLTDLYKVWTIEQNGDYHSLRNVGNTNPRFVQTEFDRPWDLDFNDQWNLCEWTNFKLAYNSEGTYWTIENGRYPATEDMNDDKNGYWGPWENGGENVVNNEMRIAGNKKSDNVGQYRIFQMAKTDFHKKLISTGNFPMPFTEYINNPYINGADGWTIEKPNGGNGPLLNNNAFEYWIGTASNGAFDYYQEIDVPNGKYIVSAYMYNSTNGAGGSVGGECGVYATSGDVIVFKPVDVDGTSYLEYTTDEITVTNKKLRIGVKNRTTMTARWFVADNFKLISTDLYISELATPFTGTGTLEAGKWYVYDVINKGEYKFSATEGVVYTYTDVLQKEVTTTDATSLMELTEGKLYFKSAETQFLEIAPSSFGYTLDEATRTTNVIDDSYINIKDFASFVVTYPNAKTNDPNATLALFDNTAVATLWKDGEQLATETISADGNTLTAAFANVALELNSAYQITIPAGVFGYEGNATNEAITVDFKTGIIAEEVYYFKRNGTETYLTRGGNWGTEAVTDKFGIAFEAILQTDGTYHFKNVDHSLAEGVDRYLSQYTDAVSAEKWGIESTEGGYYMKRGGKYLKTKEQGEWRYNYIDDTDNPDEAIVWTILTEEEYKQSLVDRKNNEAKVVAEKAGLTVEDLTDLESALSSKFISVDATERIVNAELINNNTTGWTAVSYNDTRRNQTGDGDNKVDVIRTNNCAEVWAYVGGAKQTISNLPEGIYKVTVKATWRLANSTEASRVGDKANVTAWMYANDNYTQLKNWSEIYGPADNYHLTVSGDEFVNTVYVYVSGKEDLTIGIASPSWCRETWMPFCHWTLTKYAQETTANMTITDAGWATFIAPFEVEIPEGVTAYTVAGVKTDNYLNKTALETVIPANTPVLLEGAAMTETFYGLSTATQNTYGEVLVGNVSGKTMNVSAGSYGLLNQNDKLGFYQVEFDTDNVTVGNNRCYLTVPAGSEIKAFFFDDEATGINSVDTAGATVVERYNAAGIKIAAPVKGLNIVKMSNGKTQKVLVK